MERTGVIPNREQIADEIKQVIDEVYRGRYRSSEDNTFNAIKRATDHALGELRSRGQAGIADRLTTEISHQYLMKHRYQRMPALAAFIEAADEVLEKFAAGEIV